MTAELADRAAALLRPGKRVLLGITGPPGAGKSTLAETLGRRLGPLAAVVPMDGFHLANEELRRLGRTHRKGAPDTFDSAGYVALLQRLRQPGDATVYAPAFSRILEAAIAGSIPVTPDVELIVTEGNYLLADGGFAPVRDLLDEVWFLDVDPGVLHDRLVRRHVAHGRTAAAAESWVRDNDEVNARLIEATRSRADLQVRLSGP